MLRQRVKADFYSEIFTRNLRQHTEQRVSFEQVHHRSGSQNQVQRKLWKEFREDSLISKILKKTNSKWLVKTLGNTKIDLIFQDIPSDLHLPKLEGVSDKFMYVAILGWFVSKPKRGALIFCCDYCARELAIRFVTSDNRLRMLHWFDKSINHKQFKNCNIYI